MGCANATWQKIRFMDLNKLLPENKNNKRRIVCCSQTNPTTTITTSGASSTTTTAAEPAIVMNTTTASSSQWPNFAKRVSGEWDGFGAEFSPEGKPFELPESVVPEAYREWEVKVFDWQTQCPTLAEPDDFFAKYKLIKLLPTVGCEADAATVHSVDERNIGGVDNNVAAFAYQSSGCYVAVWSVKKFESFSLLELEHSLVDPHNQESRIRIIQSVRNEDGKLAIKNIKVFVEQWYGPFRNGEQLGGCSIRDTAFASTEALKGSEVAGIWQGLNAIAIFHNSEEILFQEFVQNSVQSSLRDENNLILLPKNLWCSMKEEKGETQFEVGWLLSQGHAITSKCIFSCNAELKEITTSCETKTVTVVHSNPNRSSRRR